ncbi:hypothetical protein F4823DRAFT_569324 [Ustulina deusta]|nr:hypothetical protein F4823DRAFT_569324 [Ustulina deusta]
MAAAQQRMEETANNKRSPADRFEKEDWKLAWLHSKYKVTKVISPTPAPSPRSQSQVGRLSAEPEALPDCSSADA